jgi:two-component system, NarL family, response regulator DegU
VRQFPEIKVVILSVHIDDETVLASMRTGARAFLVKKASSDDLLGALRTVMRGGSYIGAHVSDRLLVGSGAK